MTEPSKAVFLSYASQDAGNAHRICEALRGSGVEVWFDQSELRGGDAWDATIRRQIKTCALFIPIISRNALARQEGYFRLEWKLAVDRSHLMATTRTFLLPVVVDDTRNGDESAPEGFREIQWTRLSDAATMPAFAERVRRILSSEELTVEPAVTARVPASAAATFPAAEASSARVSSSKRAAICTRIAIAALVAVVAYLAVDKLVLSKRSAGLTSSTPDTAAATPVLRANPRSIAVLPFSDMSEKKDQEYFSDGLAETLLDLLAKTPGLHVIARTSSFSFKGKSDDIPTIAEKLHVANVLEGSVRKSGNRLRVTTQLVRALDGEHLWSETYDRELADVFKVQDEIAAAVVAALKLKLAPSQISSAQQTASPAAYNEYLLGRQFSNRFNVEGLNRAVDSYRKAFELDPSYAAAYAAFATTEWFVADETNDADGFSSAVEAAEKAVALAPTNGAGYAARGFLRAYHFWDWTGAEDDLRKAIALDPGDPENYLRYGFVLLALKRYPEGRTAIMKSLDLDPLSTQGWIFLSNTQLSEGNLHDAEASIRRALEVSPDATRALGYFGYIQILQGHPRESLSTFEKISDARWLALTGTAIAQKKLGNDQQSRQALEELEKDFSATAAYQIGEVHAARGETDLAVEWLERAYRQRDTGLALATHDPWLDSLRGAPRFKALLAKMKLPD
jgi:adenylate cyclase